MLSFLSPSTLKVIAEGYEQGLLGHLNEHIKGASFLLLGYNGLRNVPCGQAQGTAREPKHRAD